MLQQRVNMTRTDKIDAKIDSKDDRDRNENICYVQAINVITEGAEMIEAMDKNYNRQ